MDQGFAGARVIDPSPHICVCVCTYRRPELLSHLLQELLAQDTEGRITYSIVVVDNDRLESARSVTARWAASAGIPVKYCVEARRGISPARNTAIENATGDFLAFIDDDEWPTRRWLLTLLEACHQYRADGVLGPVRPHFEEAPPRWVIKGRFYERPAHATGFVIGGREGRTGNVLLKREMLEGERQPFDPRFLTGEDQDFFARMIARGRVFIWCNDALAYETVPPVRWKRRFMVKRALLSGSMSPLQPAFGVARIARSCLAVVAYAAGLPLTLPFGHHRFMQCAIKLCDHLGGLLALVGIRPIKGAYVTE
jgi:glycosyltransferase involved in cell wall biosynthesis